MSIKLIIFDLDGTLIDSSVDIMNALNYALQPYNVKPVTVTDTIAMVGEGITRLIEKLVGDKEAEVKADVMRRFLGHYSNHILDNTKQYPGVRETLEWLQEGAYKKAVISNKRESLSREVLSGLGLLNYFDVVVGSDTTPERKPSPVPVRVVLSELHVPPCDAVIVGDSSYDVDAGRAAGVLTVAVTYGYRPREVIAHADHLIERMADLIPLIERINNCGKTPFRETSR
ncbi:MAG TPA: HAD-IA family hydrolase [Thermodesulfovibrionales bacterium]|nr:HAD-IA family hydrolase [Thermodesulfovibrionales bacterium]